MHANKHEYKPSLFSVCWFALEQSIPAVGRFLARRNVSLLSELDELSADAAARGLAEELARLFCPVVVVSHSGATAIGSERRVSPDQDQWLNAGGNSGRTRPSKAKVPRYRPGELRCFVRRK